MDAATAPPGDQRPIADTNMDIDMDLDLGPEPEHDEPEPEAIQTVSTLTECASIVDHLHKTNSHIFSLLRMRLHKKALSNPSPRRRCSKGSIFAVWTN